MVTMMFADSKPVYDTRCNAANFAVTASIGRLPIICIFKKVIRVLKAGLTNPG